MSDITGPGHDDIPEPPAWVDPLDAAAVFAYPRKDSAREPGMTDEELIARARALAAVQGTAAVNERFPGWNDNTAAYVEAFGTAQHLLAELADALGRHAAPDAIIVAWCKRCRRAVISVPCPRCGGPACANPNCGRCPPCDGDLPAEEE